MKLAIDYAKIADIYDIYVQATTDILFFLKEAKKTAGPVLELMSGTGRISIPLIEKGIDLTCVDRSPEMLNILKRKLMTKNMNARTHLVDVCRLKLHTHFDLIFLPFQSFSELLSHEDQTDALKSIYDHLSKHGRFICTLHNPVVRSIHIDGQLRLLGKFQDKSSGGTLLLWSFLENNPTDKQITGLQFYEFYNKDGKMTSKRCVDVAFTLIERDDFEDMIHRVGFKISKRYGNYDYSSFNEKQSPFMIFEMIR